MTDASDGLAPGTRLDEFEIRRVLGAGGFGVTYLARDVSLEAWRAVKEYMPWDWGTRRQDGTIAPRTAGDADDYQWGLDRFLQEARILARFDHRHLVRVYRVFRARGTAYMVTEYVEGRTLAAEAAETGPLPEARLRELLDALSDGLAEVHAAGLLHRDIKPANVMVRPDGTPVLIDFGTARQAMGRHSRSVTAVLTPGYAPIEQYSARGRQGPWTDIYALGALAYWALSGEAPDDATERVVQADGLRPIAEVARGPVSARLASAVEAALAVNGADRPQSLTEWQAMLEEHRAAPRAPSSPLPPPSPTRASTLGNSMRSFAGPAWAWRWRLAGAVAAGSAGLALLVALTPPANRTRSLHDEAALGNDPSIVEGLVAAGADVEARDNNAGTPLHQAAASNDDPAIVEALVAAGADVEARTDFGRTPLHRAAGFSDDPSIVEALVAAGADVQARDDDGDTPLHRAAVFSDEPSIVEALVAAGADVEARDGGGETPLHRAAVSSDERSIVEALVAAGADVDARDNFGHTPLHGAAGSSDEPSIVEALVAAGADVDARDNFGHTPLHRAVSLSDEPSIVEALVAAGADVEARDDLEQTPLHRAAWFSDDPAIVEALIAAGADPTAQRFDGLTPWDLAQRNVALRGTDVDRRLREARGR